MNDKQRQDVLQTLGNEALTHILSGDPQVIDADHFSLVVFWVGGQECEYYFGTEPPLLRQVETDKEFVTFADLLEEVCELA